MSNFEYVFFKVNMSPQAVAEQLSRLPGMRLERTADGRVFVSRACQDGRGTVGGEISANEHILSGHETALDGYDVVFEIHVRQGDRNSQFAEAEKIFKESVGALGSPALLVRNLDLLSAAWSPARGLTRFPEGTTPDEEHETLWRPVVAAIERGQKH